MSVCAVVTGRPGNCKLTRTLKDACIQLCIYVTAGAAKAGDLERLISTYQLAKSYRVEEMQHICLDALRRHAAKSDCTPALYLLARRHELDDLQVINSIYLWLLNI